MVYQCSGNTSRCLREAKGSIPLQTAIKPSLTSGLSHQTFNLDIAGSNPVGGAKLFNKKKTSRSQPLCPSCKESGLDIYNVNNQNKKARDYHTMAELVNARVCKTLLWGFESPSYVHLITMTKPHDCSLRKPKRMILQQQQIPQSKKSRRKDAFLMENVQSRFIPLSSTNTQQPRLYLYRNNGSIRRRRKIH